MKFGKVDLPISKFMATSEKTFSDEINHLNKLNTKGNCKET